MSPDANQPTQNYDVNFFFPKTEHSRANMRMVFTMVLIWAVAVFGFQILLAVTNQPTPEADYQAFQSVWPKAQNASASNSERQELAQTLLSVLGKNIALKPEHKAVLQDALNHCALQLIQPDQIEEFKTNLASAETKPQAVAAAAQAIGLQNSGFDQLKRDFLNASLQPSQSSALSNEVPQIMELYLVHNQSALTDFRWLGFPFHYWYTAQFLLVLFVLLCLVYAVATDRLNKQYNFEDE